MFLWHIFKVKPFAALAVVLCLATILACFLLERRRPRKQRDRFLIGVLGLLAIYQGFRILEGVGILSLDIGTTWDDMIELAIAGFYLVCAVMMRLSSNDRLDVESAIRLAQAAPPRSSRQIELSRDLGMDSLGWALPRLSDGAFKLYAFLCLRTGNTPGRVPVGVQDIRVQLHKTKEELDGYLVELENAGAVSISREATGLNIEIVPQSRRKAAAVPDDLPRASLTLPA